MGAIYSRTIGFVQDMFEKMLQVDPTAPTAEELQLGGVTKPRYMVWRETISSTASLGFRIEGIRKQDGSSSKDYKTVGSPKQIMEVLLDFVQHHPHALVSCQHVTRVDSYLMPFWGSSLGPIHRTTESAGRNFGTLRVFRRARGEISHVRFQFK